MNGCSGTIPTQRRFIRKTARQHWFNGIESDRYEYEEFDGQPPETAQPAQVHATENYVLLLGSKRAHARRTPGISRTIGQELATIHPSLRVLVNDVEFIKEPYEIKEELMKSKNPVLAVSDGSGKDGAMTFGWSVSVGGREVIKNKGPAFGSESSHRAEGYGQLSLFVVLKTLFEFADIPFDTPIRYGCDNQGLLTRVRERQKYADLYPNATLATDWDIVEAINEYRQRFQNIKQEHVKGHQDENAEFENLPHMVQLNVLADRYAGEYQEDEGMQRPLVPMLPTTKCQLTIPGNTVTRGIMKHIRRHHATKRIKPRFIKLHGIENENGLDWTAFHAAVVRFPNKR